MSLLRISIRARVPRWRADMELAARPRSSVLARLANLPRTFVIGFVMLAAAIATPLIGPMLLHQDPLALTFAEALKPPSAAHWMGTDNFGRDVLTRVVYATSIDLQFGFVSVVPTFLIGTLLGVLAGMNRRFDAILMRLLDLVVAFPIYVLVIAIVAALGPGVRNMYIGILVIGWAAYARVVRNEVLVVRSLPYVEAAQVLGFSRARILARHVLPNVIVQPVVMATTNFVAWILLGSSLGFLGLGVQPPTAEWGVMISEGRNFLVQAPWFSIFPGLAIFFVCSGAIFLGDGLGDLLRPEVSRR
jgi:peptide/nickel transport system permease protein